MLSKHTNQQNSTVGFAYMCPRGLSGPAAVTLTNMVMVYLYNLILILCLLDM